MSTSKYEQNLYNTHLHVSRVSRNKPFTARKDFSKLGAEKAAALKRIGNMLLKYPHITPELYFKAPYELYPDEEHFELKYYAGMGAIKTYTQYMKRMRELPPDHEYQMEEIKKSLKFIAKFCSEKQISLSNYITYQTGVTFDWMKHVKQHQVTIYALMEFPEMFDKIMSVPEEEREMFLGDTGKYFLGYKTKYNKSSDARHLVSEAIKRIDKLLSAVE
jgi:hypothetical protein